MPKFRSALAAVALAAASLSAAAADVSGIYQIPFTREYLAVQQKDNVVIVGYYFTGGADAARTLGNGQVFMPPRTDRWELYSGLLAGNVAAVAGETAFGACISSWEIDFAGGQFRLTGMQPTVEGVKQGIDCGAVYRATVNRAGSSFPLVRVF